MNIAAMIRRPVRLLACFVAFTALFGGAAFLLVADPAALSNRSAGIAALAFASDDYDAAKQAALGAVRADPSNAAAWAILSLASEKTGRFDEARRFSRIATVLRQGPADAAPLYAAPADLRLSALAPSEIPAR